MGPMKTAHWEHASPQASQAGAVPGCWGHGESQDDMGTGVTFKPGGPSCPGGPCTPTPGDPCMVAESTRCVPQLAGMVVLGALCHPEWPPRAGKHPTSLGPGDTHLLSFGS